MSCCLSARPVLGRSRQSISIARYHRLYLVMEAGSADSKGVTVTCEAPTMTQDDNTTTSGQTPHEDSSQNTIPEPDDPRRGLETPAATKFEIYWRWPITMVSTFVLGLSLSCALHGYYSSLDGKQVADTEQQQMALRYHSIFLLNWPPERYHSLIYLMPVSVLHLHISRKWASWVRSISPMFSACGGLWSVLPSRSQRWMLALMPVVHCFPFSISKCWKSSDLLP